MVDLYGSYGNDSLVGTATDDVIFASWGDDTVGGGAGNDTIFDDGGNISSIAGGAGDDRIEFFDYLGSGSAFQYNRTAVTIDGGDGNDWVNFRTSRYGTVNIALGTGDDVLVLQGGTAYAVEQGVRQITLGAGSDSVRLENDFGIMLAGTIGFAPYVITDFTAGAGGDVLYLGTLLAEIYTQVDVNPGSLAANPFASGYLLLVQDGADTLVRIDFDGSGSGTGETYTRDVLRLANVNAATLTAFNFAGLAPDGSAPQATTIAGTAGDDRLFAADSGSSINASSGNDLLFGAAGNDSLFGSAGNDSLSGGRGDDRLLGGNDSDTIDGGLGNDFIDGGAGNDLITEGGGNDTVLGGLGDDTISFFLPTFRTGEPPRSDVVSIDGGDGNDRVSFTIERFGGDGTQSSNVLLTANLGAGDDTFFVDNLRAQTVLTLGTGRDRVEFGALYSYLLSGRQPLTITDFAAGNTGDILDMGLLLSRGTGWNMTGNPFATGFLRLAQSGADVLVQWDYDGEGNSDEPYTIAVLRNVAVGALTAANFAGYDPAYSAGSGQVITGTIAANWLHGSELADQIAALDGNDQVTGGFGGDTIDGGAGDDTLDGGFGNDSLLGGLGNDLIQDNGEGSDTLIGGDGNDTISVDHIYTFQPEALVISAGNGADELNLRVGTSSGNSANVTADMGSGNDRVTIFYVGQGTTTLTLGAGADTVVLDAGLSSQTRGPIVITDFQTGAGGDRLDWLGFLLQYGRVITPDNDGLNIYNPFYWGQARLIQQGGDVLLQMTRSPATAFGQAPDETVVVFQNTTLASFTQYNLGVDFALDTVVSTSGNNSFGGTAGRDVVRSIDGNDTALGLGGDDLLDGGAGNDSIDGGDGNDYLLGGGGNDTLLGGIGDDFLNGGQGRNRIDGGDGNDRFHVDWYDTALGGNGDDRAYVQFTWYQDIINSGIPAGSLNMGGGNDYVQTTIGSFGGLAGGFGINLGSGNDRIVVDGAFGTLTLGTGRDRVELVGGPDSGSELVITDFQTGNAGDVFAFEHNYRGVDIFAWGIARLVQDGADVVLTFDTALFNGLYSYDSFPVRFLNTTVAQFTAANFDGFDPHAVPPPQTITIDAANVTLAAGSTTVLHNQQGTTTGVAGYLYESASGTVQFTNHGSVDISTTGPWYGPLTGFAVSPYSNLTASSRFTNAADGQFIVHSNSSDVTGVQSRADFGIRNYGLLDVSATAPADYEATATGFYSEATSLAGRPLNAGTLRVRSTSDAYGAVLWGAPLTNTGLIDVRGDVFAVGLDIHYASGQVLTNSGTILVRTDPASAYASIGVLFESLPQNDGHTIASSFVNSGTIDADIALYSLDFSSSGKAERFDNSGVVHGAVVLADGDDVVNNSGQMDSRTLLGAGADFYDGTLGQHTGSVEGGTGKDTLLGGTGGELLFGDAGNDLIAAGGGADYVDGGTGSDLLDGGAGYDVVSWLDAVSAVRVDLTLGTAVNGGDTDYVRNFEQVIGSRGHDTIGGSALNDVLMGYRGNDQIDGRFGNDTLWGGLGNDTLNGGAGNDWFVFDAGDGGDVIADFKGQDRIAIHGYTGYQSMTQVGADVRIVLSASDSILVRGTSVSSLTAQNLLFSAAPSGLVIPDYRDATLFPEENVIVSAGSLIDMGDTQSLRIRYSLVESTAIALEAPYGVDGLGVWNAGTIRFATSDVAAQSVGIFSSIANGHGGRNHWVVNQAGGRIEVTAQHADAFGIMGVGAVWNHGTIAVTSLSGNASGVAGLQPNTYGLVPGTFVNTGAIVVNAAATGRGVDQQTNTGSVDLMVNSGSITVHGGSASHGIENNMNAHPAMAIQPMLVNSGTITVTDDTAARDSAGLFLDISSRAQVWNSGTITADNAIEVFRGSSYASYMGYTLAVYNSGTLNGRVVLSAYDDTLVNTNQINGDVALGGGNDLYEGRSGVLVGSLDGGDGNDTLLAGGGAQGVLGGFGDDVLSGGSGNDGLTGGLGVDVFRFETGFGADVITDFQTGAQHDWIDVRGYTAYQSIVQQGADVLITFAAGQSLLVRGVLVADLTGGAIRFGAAAIGTSTIPAAPVPTSAPATPAPTPPDPNITFPAITGTAASETLIGGAGPDSISGLGGNDLLDGGTGSDFLIGGEGNDTYRVDAAGDTLTELAGQGTDTVLASLSWTLLDGFENLQLLAGFGPISGTGNAAANAITGNEGANVLTGLDGDDTLSGQGGSDRLDGGGGADSISGSGGNDTVLGGDGDDRASGGVGLDVLDGGLGADALAGDSGADTLTGGDGADTLTGGQARDLLTGGAGADMFVFGLNDFGSIVHSGAERITDFSHAAGDRIDLSLIDASTAAAGNNAFAFIGNAAFSHVAGELRFVLDAGNTYVEGDRTGDGLADFTIRLDGAMTLVAADFVL